MTQTVSGIVNLCSLNLESRYKIDRNVFSLLRYCLYCLCMCMCSVYQEPLLTAAYTADRYQVSHCSSRYRCCNYARCRNCCTSQSPVTWATPTGQHSTEITISSNSNNWPNRNQKFCCQFVCFLFAQLSVAQLACRSEDCTPLYCPQTVVLWDMNAIIGHGAGDYSSRVHIIIIVINILNVA